MTEDFQEAVDLLGDPWTEPRDPRGRKTHRRLPQIAERIAVLRAGGSTQEEIAAVIGLSVKTLTKHYSRELEGGAALARQVLLGVMWDKAKGGNVAAARFVDEKLAKGEVLAADRALADRGSPDRATKLGLKEQRQQAAEQVSGKFAPPAAPKLVVSNP